MSIKRKVPLPRQTKPIARSAIKPRTTRPPRVNRKRQASEFARTVHSRARQRFVSSLPCVVAACAEGPCHGHHIENGGMSRKADYTRIVSLCPSHHRFLHHHGPVTFAASFPLRNGWTLVDWATETERLWGGQE